MPGQHLLVIDDSPTLLKVVEIALTKAGYRVDTAADGNAGLALVREKSTVPDLILLDGMMPGGDPADICTRLAGDSSLSKVPVVVMASKGDDLGARFAKAPNVVDYISKPFSPEALQAVVSHVIEGGAPRSPATPTLADAGDALAGDLAVISTSDVLELLGEKGLTGTLEVVSAAGGSIEISVRAGHIEQAVASGLPEEFLLGRFAARAGHIAPAALDAVVEARARAAEKPPLMGADLVARNLLGASELQQALARQSSELTCEALRWTEGKFRFKRTDAAGLPELARQAALGINVDRLLIEAFRRVDEWRVIERELPSFDEVFVRNEDKIAELPRGTFTRDELAVLETINGRHTIRETIRILRMGSFDVSKVLFRLLRAKLVRRRVGPTAT